MRTVSHKPTAWIASPFRAIFVTCCGLGIIYSIIEHMTNLGSLPDTGFTFTAVPPKIEGAGTFTVRAFATLP